jgi:Vacuolar protein sorting 55
MTGFLVITGIGTSRSRRLLMTALPVALMHSNIITAGAMVMSIFGGLLIYGTITVYSHFFSLVSEEF